MKGFMRLLEVVIVLILMFTLMSSLIQRNPPIQQSLKNTKILERYTDDAKNMVCNSESDRTLIFSASSMTRINDTLKYVLPYDMKFQVVVLDSSDTFIKSVGYGVPDLADSSEVVELVSSGCVVTDRAGVTRKVLVQTWY